MKLSDNSASGWAGGAEGGGAAGSSGRPIRGAPRAEPVEQEFLEFAVDTARRAGEVTLEWYQHKRLAVTPKHDGSPVTQADHAAERFLRAEITAAWPDDAILGEEEPQRPGSTGRTWVVDPIDGTRAFAQGVPLYATLLAMVDGLGPAVGVISLPALDECVWAGRGRGALWDGEPCGVSDTPTLDGAYVCTSGLSYWPERALARLREAGARVRTWGDAYGYALVATGRAAAMVDPECFDWDVAPMSVIIVEAGGRFSDTAGNDSWQQGSAIGSNARLHQQILRCFE